MTTNAVERRKNLQYVRDMLEQLKVVSGAREGSMLGYLMDMARLEAEHQLTLLKPSDD
ncbi:hypothetical protein [Aurantimonas sp. VKM B-3413]|uniref:hypothetical protein n=1 Tax=Aurantimonas sp. VKM B-3413 TaxID=2779401 RepID=UPI001E4AD83D|nr:hypothetical protein [Aurantimonas sp. VKM B-3413]MCB8837084.1 hypothetical protein [Aurantimonas sp. VKM B-3413]